MFRSMASSGERFFFHRAPPFRFPRPLRCCDQTLQLYFFPRFWKNKHKTKKMCNLRCEGVTLPPTTVYCALLRLLHRDADAGASSVLRPGQLFETLRAFPVGPRVLGTI